ncbi:hypothetical protein DICVIV_03343 [Dictyocaulus viviparus]|uniref:COMM domain-containing protein n=1 Tax=Dictyocaulus viviparus TaxID=29172 RepID=A0A0D8Y0U7_DICVI|nr:hypothetical protein DICVIV_03343 [Dictyocaulus viviparus]
MSSRGIELLHEVLSSRNAPSEDQAQRLAEKLFSILTGEERWTDELCPHKVAESVWTVFTDGARLNWSADTLREKLNSSHPFSTAVVERKVDMLRSQLNTIGWDYPELIDCECTLLNTVQTELLNRVSEPFVSLKLHTLSAGETKSKRIEIHLDANQFQDLHWKVKEAENIIKQLKKR